jgi:hypothetical protein
MLKTIPAYLSLFLSLGLIEGEPAKEAFAFEWIIKDWQRAITQLHKKQDVLSPVYRSHGYEWRLRLRRDKGTKRLGMFVELVGALRSSSSKKSNTGANQKQIAHGGSSAGEEEIYSSQIYGEKPLFAATFGLGFAQCFDSRQAVLESTKRAVIFRPGEYQWGWAKHMTIEAIERDFVRKNCVALRTVIRVH